MYIVTKHGFVHLYDIETGTRIYSNRISTETVFVTTEYQTSGGIMGINRKGQVGEEIIGKDFKYLPEYPILQNFT